MSEEAPLTPAQLAAIGRAEQARRPDALVPVYDAEQDATVEVPANEVEDYRKAGFATGPAAAYAAKAQGFEGKLASALTSLGSGASLGALDLVLPKNLAVVKEQVDTLHPVIHSAFELAGSIAPNILAGELAGGAAAARGATYAAKGKLAMLGAAAGRVMESAVEGGVHAARDAARLKEPLTFERFALGVGLSGLIGAFGEAGGAALHAAAPAFQRRIGKSLTQWSKSDQFTRLAETVERPAAEAQVALAAEHTPLWDEAATEIPFAERFAGGKKRRRYRMPEAPPLEDVPSEPPSWSLPPEDGIPFERATLIEEQEPNALLKEREARTAARLAEEPLGESEYNAYRSDMDREARDAALSGQSEAAAEYRTMRDGVDPASILSDEDKLAWQSQRKELLAPDAELETKFEGLGWNTPINSELTPPPLELGMTDPPLRTMRPSKPVPLPPEENPILRSRDFSGLRRAARVKNLEIPKEPKPPKLPLPTQASLNKAAKNMPLGEIESLYGRLPAKYKMKKDPGLMNTLGKRSIETAALAFIPGIGPPLAKAYGALSAITYTARKAQLAALNHEYAINRIVDYVIDPAAKLTGKTVRTLLNAEAPEMSSSYLHGDPDAEYKAIVAGVNRLANQPEAMESYYNQRYGEMMAQHKELYGGIVGQASRSIQYLNTRIPRDPRPQPGLLAEPYDPPRSVKVKVIQAYKGVNDPFSALLDPTYESVAAVSATHPETLQTVRDLLIAKLQEPKVVDKLTRVQKRQISIVLGIPLSHADSHEFVAGLQETAVANSQGQPLEGPAQPQQAQQQAPVLSGPQAKSFASMVAPPSQQNQLENMQ